MTKSAKRPRVYPADPARPPQTIGGGFLIACRDRKTGRLRKVGAWPYEHASILEAEAQARVLARTYKQVFCVFQDVAAVMPPAVLDEDKPGPSLVPASKAAPASEAPKRRTVVVERIVSRRQAVGGRA